MPHFITETCIGCGVCEIKCPTHTITGGRNEKFVIHADRCIDCSVCARYCPVSCIQDQRGELVEKVKPKDIPKAIVDRDLCTGCEFCIDICPFDCIYLIDDPLHETFHKIAEVDAGPCVSCRLCETVCEKDAIFVPNPITQAKRYLPGPVIDPPKETPRPEEDDLPEEPRGAGRLIARFFLLPLLVVGAAVGIFLLFNLMTFERRSPGDYLAEVRGGTASRRWQAAFELSRSLGALAPEERAALSAETLRIFEGLSNKRPDDVPVRRYLVLVLGTPGRPGRRPGAAPGRPRPRSGHRALRRLGSRQDRGPGGRRHGAGDVPLRGRRGPQDGRLRPRAARAIPGRFPASESSPRIASPTCAGTRRSLWPSSRTAPAFRSCGP